MIDKPVGTCSTVADAVAERLPEVAVSVASPLPIAVTSPLELTVATVGSALDQVTCPLTGTPLSLRTVAVS